MKLKRIALTGAVLLLAAAPAPARSAKLLAPQSCALGVQRPTNIIFFCGDAGALIGHLHWTRWGGPIAVGTGIYSVKTCVPDCAGGGARRYAATIRLTGTQTCDGHASRFYRRATLRLSNGTRVTTQLFCPS